MNSRFNENPLEPEPARFSFFFQKVYQTQSYVSPPKWKELKIQ